MSNQEAEEGQEKADGHWTKQQRDEKGHFGKKIESENNGSSQPSTSDYVKMNTLLAKNLGLGNKLADLQSQHSPHELFKQLSFMADHTDRSAPKSTGQLPPNENFVPISPKTEKIELEGIEFIEKPNLSKDKFSASYRMQPRDLFRQKDKNQN